jgi:hypothetical protein
VNLSETAHALALMQAFDQRTVGDADVIAWQSVLADADLRDVEEAVRRHYAEQTDRILPAHVRRLVRDIHTERVMLATATGWAPGQYGVPKDDALPPGLKPGATGERLALSDLPAAVADLVAQVRAGLPEGSREALMPRRVAWEQEHKAYLRSHGGEPNPLYRPIEERECVVTGDGECQTHNRHVSSCPASGRGPVRTTAEVCVNSSHEHFPGDPVLPTCAYRSGSAEMSTGVLPNAHRCASCSFTTASAERMDGHLRATGHVHE